MDSSSVCQKVIALTLLFFDIGICILIGGPLFIHVFFKYIHSQYERNRNDGEVFMDIHERDDTLKAIHKLKLILKLA
ncbi:hypothetical protein PVAND_013414 [Polypedilum vanderplanki]|uniref:Uncharacterized protein n=1 Tax=Polypedilum vanderplanki TaxID=319348 RepID=A0A9J6CQ92_POLVA|nr:hypothetical protein PVAND_013414 [Polypedilum vanderplanki]